MNFADWVKKAKYVRLFITSFPLIAGPFARFSSVPFPPLGDRTFMYRSLSALLIGASGLVCYGVRPTRKRLRVLFLLSGLTALTYVALDQAYVRTYPLGNGAKAFVVFGDLLDPPLCQIEDRPATPYNLVYECGFRDAQLELVFTRSSLILHRMLLLSAYTALLSLAHAFVGTRAND